MTKPWYWRSLNLKCRTGSDIFAKLFLDNPMGIGTLLESPFPNYGDKHILSRYSICAGAPRIIHGEVYMWTPPLGEILPFLKQLNKNNSSHNLDSTPTNLPFCGGWLGWLGYDVAWEIEDLPYTKKDTLPFPVAFWYEPESFAVLDHLQQVLWVAATNKLELDHLQQKLDREDDLEESILITDSSKNNFYPLESHSFNSKPLEFHSSRSDYQTAVDRVKKYIQAGDIFQANLSLRFASSTNVSGWQIYRNLQKINPSPFASYWKTPWGEVVSCSPERLVKLESTNKAETRPIAGTRMRGKSTLEDEKLAQDLIKNTKERAEHIMLVDLERNDLGRVCEWGSVNVDELLVIERYSHVMHLVSNVKGILKSQFNGIDLIQSMFPGGTITGCPKVRCMEIIEELEPVRRSLFYGSCGYLDLKGNLDLNILIRTLLLTPDSALKQEKKVFEESPYLDKDMAIYDKSSPVIPQQKINLINPLAASMNKPYYLESSTQTMNDRLSDQHLHKSALNIVWGQVGAGIVADSDSLHEWYESLQKAQAQLAALKISE
ncbi:MAG: anthranilate synthase component I [Cyanobacteria bacterium P01_A01_bin.45]